MQSTEDQTKLYVRLRIGYSIQLWVDYWMDEGFSVSKQRFTDQYVPVVVLLGESTNSWQW